jgi:hypothetical protein
MRFIRRITGIEGVYPGAATRNKLPTNRRYHGVTYFLTAAGVRTDVSTLIDKVRIYVNGITMWDVPASALLAEAARSGRTLAVGELPIEFSDPMRADKIDEQITAWDLFGEVSFEVELVLKDVADIGITGLMEFDFGQNKVGDKVLKQVVKKFSLAKNANAGENDLDNIPIRDAIQRLTFFAASVPTDFKVDVDGNTVLESNTADLERIYIKHGFVPVGGSASLRFDYTERIEDFLVARKDMNVRFKVANAGLVTCVVESLAPGFL